MRTVYHMGTDPRSLFEVPEARVVRDVYGYVLVGQCRVDYRPDGKGTEGEWRASSRADPQVDDGLRPVLGDYATYREAIREARRADAVCEVSDRLAVASLEDMESASSEAVALRRAAVAFSAAVREVTRRELEVVVRCLSPWEVPDLEVRDLLERLRRVES